MRSFRRDRLEYMLYATVMTSTTVALGLILAFGFDEHGQKRKPVANQPLEESMREANLEAKEYAARKYHEGLEFADRRGYGDLYRKLFGSPTGNRQNNHASSRPPSFLDAAADNKNKKNERWWS
ncbi:expressed unknown protein [Seminavis robusta]|uniref:Uncharacterized protein n=1 Tax=Seminavis robusta TaxID=568900 RepID=A0A9N8HYD1_9STRA|nr:expressed unknown protein [Seminavis robusta]|eukprot:Sro2804_g337460.1 n/a (124) ;mRNA; f:6065-6436